MYNQYLHIIDENDIINIKWYKDKDGLEVGWKDDVLVFRIPTVGTFYSDDKEKTNWVFCSSSIK